MEIENINPAGAGSGIRRSERTPPEPPVSPESGKAPAPSAEPTDEVSLSSEAKTFNPESVPSEGNSTASLINSLRRVRSLTEDNDLVVKVVDPETNEVIRQIPQEEALQLREAIRTILDRGQIDI